MGIFHLSYASGVEDYSTSPFLSGVRTEANTIPHLFSSVQKQNSSKSYSLLTEADM